MKLSFDDFASLRVTGCSFGEEDTAVQVGEATNDSGAPLDRVISSPYVSFEDPVAEYISSIMKMMTGRQDPDWEKTLPDEPIKPIKPKKMPGVAK